MSVFGHYVKDIKRYLLNGHVLYLLIMELLEETVSRLDITEIAKLKSFILDRELSLGIGHYSKAKIYNVVEKVTGIIAYTGSTIKDLVHRWSGHKSFFKKCPDAVWSKYVADHGGPDNFDIVLVKECPCRTLQELLAIERDYIVTFKPVCNIMMTNTKLTRAEQKWERLATLLLHAESTARRFRIEAVVLQRTVLSSLSSYPHLDLQAILQENSSRRFFINCLNELGVALPEPKYSPELPTPESVHLIRHICKVLGLSHSQDTSTAVTAGLLQEKLGELQTVVKKYQALNQIAESTAASESSPKNRTPSRTSVQALKLNVDTVFKHFAGTKLIAKSIRSSRAEGRARKYTYQLQPSEQQVSKLISILSKVDQRNSRT